LIIDEADKVTQQGNFKDVINIIEYLQTKDNNVHNDIEYEELVKENKYDELIDINNNESGNIIQNTKMRQIFLASATLCLDEKLRNSINSHKQNRKNKKVNTNKTLYNMEKLIETIVWQKGKKPIIIDLTENEITPKKLNH